MQEGSLCVFRGFRVDRRHLLRMARSSAADASGTRSARRDDEKAEAVGAEDQHRRRRPDATRAAPASPPTPRRPRRSPIPTASRRIPTGSPVLPIAAFSVWRSSSISTQPANPADTARPAAPHMPGNAQPARQRNREEVAEHRPERDADDARTERRPRVAQRVVGRTSTGGRASTRAARPRSRPECPTRTGRPRGRSVRSEDAPPRSRRRARGTPSPTARRKTRSDAGRRRDAAAGIRRADRPGVDIARHRASPTSPAAPRPRPTCRKD